MFRISTLRKGDEGQMTLDFLFGLIIFLAAIVYLVMMIPGIFLPYQNNAVDLSSVAYRTSTLLAEDPGFWQNSLSNGTDWENHMSDMARVGLAEEKAAPNVLSMNKMAALSRMSHASTQNYLGLENTQVYDYYLTITWINNSSQPTTSHTDVISGSPPLSSNVETIQRSVLVDEGKRLLVDGGQGNSAFSDTLAVNVTRNDLMNGTSANNVTLTILNAPDGYIYVPNIMGFYNYTYGVVYAVYVNNTMYPTSGSVHIDPGSRVDIVFNGTTLTDPTWGWLRDNTKVITVTFSTNMDIFDLSKVYPVKAYNETNPFYCSLYDKANLNLQVWT